MILCAVLEAKLEAALEVENAIVLTSPATCSTSDLSPDTYQGGCTTLALVTTETTFPLEPNAYQGGWTTLTLPSAAISLISSISLVLNEVFSSTELIEISTTAATAGVGVSSVVIVMVVLSLSVSELGTSSPGPINAAGNVKLRVERVATTIVKTATMTPARSISVMKPCLSSLFDRVLIPGMNFVRRKVKIEDQKMSAGRVMKMTARGSLGMQIAEDIMGLGVALVISW